MSQALAERAVRTSAAVALLSELEADETWPAGPDAGDWSALNTFAANAVRCAERGRLSAVVVAEVAHWANNRQHHVRRLARAVRVKVNTMANDCGLFDHDAGQPSCDLTAALSLAACDPRAQLDDALSELVTYLDRPDVVAAVNEMRLALA